VSFKTAAQVRSEFLAFFEARGHRVVPSSPVFPMDDPTLLFTNAGMNQFKDVFLGTGTRDYRRAVDTQKCIRVSGKHNDLEEVGVDTYHHTFFEMLGNWSFGDYFKREAIRWAWELLTGQWGIPKNRLWVTVFGGDQADGLPADEEAERLWREETDIDPRRILRFGKKANFWEMGDTGPCGPCTEIHIDRGGPGTNPEDGYDLKVGVNSGNERFLELWNLVFMQFNRLDDGRLAELPAKSVDTGMGFERVLSVLQGKNSNYDTDLFAPLFRAIERQVGRTYGGSPSAEDVAFRVIADHLRAISSAFADGALPSNTGRGYVLRRLLRRAARFGRQALGQEQPFLYRLVPAVVDSLGQAFPEIGQRREHVARLICAEEESFAATLGRGLQRFAELANRLGTQGGQVLPGDGAFELYATYGFPRDLVELMARERGLAVDGAGWSAAEERHSEASKSQGKFTQLLSAEQLAGLPETKTSYHDGERAQRTAGRARLLRLVEQAGGAGRVVAVLDQSPFYPEGGGQIGDRGQIQAEDGSFRILVEDTQRLGSVLAHIGQLEGVVQEGASVRAEVDAERRSRTAKNHTATHLLHRVLRERLGDHVAQQGSYVGPDRLRFDLSHPQAIPANELEAIELEVNRRIGVGAGVKASLESLDGAKARGAMALFGEKYGERVRVVEVPGLSLELCGGTHVDSIGEIGPFVILQERAIQAGVRRIEALTGPEAVLYMQAQRRLLTDAARLLRAPTEELPTRIEQLQEQLKEAKKTVRASAQADLGQVLEQVRGALESRDGVQLGAFDLPGLDLAGLRELGSRLKASLVDAAVVLLGREGDRVPVLALVLGQARARGLAAGPLVQSAAQELGGGGGGKPEQAQGQGLDASKVPQALARLRRDLGL
jgi:alanyl-tRNA synthetase